MRCEEANNHFDDYLDETLDVDVADALELHLLICDQCTETLHGLQDIVREAGELSVTIEPGRDLWSEIQMRLGPQEVDFGRDRKRARRLSPRRYLLAAAGVIALIVGAGLMRDVQSPSVPAADPQKLGAIEEEYRDAKDELLAALDARSDAIPIETLMTVRENLVVIEGALAEIQMALAENPEDPGLERMLYAAYQYEVNLLRQAVRLADES